MGAGAGAATRDSFKAKLRAGELDDKEVELQLADGGGAAPMMDIPGQPGGIGMINLSDMMSKAMGQARTKTLKTSVRDAWAPLIAEESDKLLDADALQREAVELAQSEGVVFIDEIDKVAASPDRRGGDVSREGVQRDLLPLIEGTTVATRYGSVKSDHVLFITSGAFHVSKPSDLLPELQGRLPIRVELKALTRDDLRRILTEPEANLVRQQQALMATEGVALDFTPDAVEALADAAVEVNSRTENIGARRLQTVMEKVVEELSFTAGDGGARELTVDGDYVRSRVGALAQDADLSRFIL